MLENLMNHKQSFLSTSEIYIFINRDKSWTDSNFKTCLTYYPRDINELKLVSKTMKTLVSHGKNHSQMGPELVF